jgi:hypothetical protein
MAKTLALVLLVTAGVARAEAPPSPPAPSSNVAATLVAAADDITRQVSALRGLTLLRPFAKGVLSREQIGAKLKERIAKEYTPEEISSEGRIMKRLGLLPADANYEKILLDLLMDQVAGFYDPFAHQLYIADWLGEDLQRPAMAHEIEHALQDEHFDLKKFATPLKEEGDRQLARSSLIEGDGTMVMLEFVVQALNLDVSKVPGMMDALTNQMATSSLGQSPALANAPRFLRETLVFPYFSGLKFINAVRKNGPWNSIDAVFKNPPESTEQVMHPEKYLAHEHPVAITAEPIAALAPQKELRRDVLGELELKVLFASQLADPEAERAAAGWGGDRLVAYGTSDGPVVVIDRSTWDTDDDAVQAESAARKFLAGLTGLTAPPADQPAIFESNGEASSVERRGRDVVLIVGAPKDARAAVATEVWSKWKVAAPGPKGVKKPAKVVN